MKINYDLAFAFRNAKLWKKLTEKQLFAIDLPFAGNTAAYCCITGQEGEHMSLSVFLGDAGFQCIRNMNQQYDELYDMDSPPMDMLLVQDCIQCSIERADQLDEDELAEVKAYARAHGMRAPYPVFRRFRPNCVPWFIENETEWQIMDKALRISLKLADELQTHSASDLGLYPINLSRNGIGAVQTSLFEIFEDKDILSRPQRIPLFDIDPDGRLTTAYIPLPPEVKTEYPAPEHLDELQIARLKKLPAGAALQCEVIRIPHPVRENDEAPYLPAMMLMLKKNAQQVVPVEPVHDAVYNPDEMAEKTLYALVDMKKRPRVIEVRTEETRAILAGICQAAGITLTVKDELPALREAHDSLREHIEGMDEDMGPIDMEASGFDPSQLGEEEREDLQRMLMMLCDMPVSELREMPDDMYSFITYLDAQGLVPEELSKKLKKLGRA